MEVGAGFKQTEVGVIPDDWDVRPLAEVARVTSGKRLPLGYFVGDKVTSYPYIRVTDMRPGGVDTRDIKYVPEAAYPSISKYRIFKEDLFISVAGTLGIVGCIPDELNGANLTENADRISAITCDKDYLLHVMLSPIVQGVIESEQTVGAQPKLALMRIRNFSIPLPPTLDEQRTIAGALGDVDALLAGLDTLIAKKRDLKQAAMQQLLTGKTRLPGFSDKWATRKFGALTVVRSERVDPRTSDAHAFCVELEHLEPHTGRLIGSTSTSAQSSLKSVFRQGDVLFGKLRAYLRKSWLADRGGVCSTEIWVLAGLPGGLIPGYLAQVVRTDSFIDVASTAYGTHMPRSDWSVVKNYELRVPPPDEQRAIATALSDMDAELAALDAQRDKTLLLKQGMMQELLTGRTRLV